jgi:hypothetical protein
VLSRLSVSIQVLAFVEVSSNAAGLVYPVRQLSLFHLWRHNMDIRNLLSLFNIAFSNIYVTQCWKAGTEWRIKMAVICFKEQRKITINLSQYMQPVSGR